MNLFYKRPLALILCIMISGFSLFMNAALEIRIAVSIIPLALIGIIFVFKDKFAGRKWLYICCCFALSMSVALGILFSSVFYPVNYHNKTLYIEGEVLSTDHTDPSTSSIALLTSLMGDERASYTVYINGGKDELSGIVDGHFIGFYGTIESFGLEEDYANTSYYTSYGYSAKVSGINNVSILGFEEKNIFENCIDGVRNYIRSSLHLGTNFETGSFLTALLTGDRTNLSNNTSLNFRRLGISHVLALSGMHLAILTAFIAKLLEKFRVGKKPRIFICALFTIFYMTIVGFTPSVTRSGLMLLIYSLLFLFSYTKDSVTSLAISVFIIIALSPTSAFDISLWLSASATLGVILFADTSDRIKKDDKAVVKIGKTFLDLLLCSVFAIGMSSAFALLYFSETSVFSLITTVVFSFICQILIYISLFVVLFGSFVPFFGQIAILLSDIMHALAETISNISWASASTDFVLVRVIGILLVFSICVFLLLDLKKYKNAFYILLSSILVLLYISCGALGVATRSGEQFIYSPVADTLLVKSEGEVNIISGANNSAFDIIDRLDEENIVYINKLIYPTYTSSIYKNTEKIISSVKTDTLYLPLPLNYEESVLAEQISNLLSSYGTSLEFYELDDGLRLGGVKFIAFYRNTFDYDKTQLFAYTIKEGENYHSYFSKGAFEADTPAKRAMILNSQTIIIGSRGAYATYIDTLAPMAEQIIVGYQYKMSEEVKEYYEEKGASIYYIDAPFTIKFSD